jgi:hypothetical protein
MDKSIGRTGGSHTQRSSSLLTPTPEWRLPTSHPAPSGCDCPGYHEKKQKERCTATLTAQPYWSVFVQPVEMFTEPEPAGIVLIVRVKSISAVATASSVSAEQSFIIEENFGVGGEIGFG